MSETDNPLMLAIPPEDQYTFAVLLVDDQPMVGEAIRRALAGEPNMDFHFCSDPAQAMEAAERFKPTVILQDLIMPGVDGLSLVRRYRDNPATKDIPIIVLSTREDPAVKSAAFQQGANDYLIKLPDNIELLARIRYHSKAYVNLQQRDEAYRALRWSQQLLVEKNIELARLINVDTLTGLNNRRHFDDVVESKWKRAIRDQTWFSILMIDVDDFKSYNDHHGHLAGDEVLKRIGEAIKKCAERPADVTARYGGEEFVVALPSSPLNGARVIGEKLRRAVEGLDIRHNSSSVAGAVTVSIGCAAAIPARGELLMSLIEMADAAMYQAKRAGKNRVVAHDNVAVPSAAGETPSLAATRANDWNLSNGR